MNFWVAFLSAFIGGLAPGVIYFLYSLVRRQMNRREERLYWAERARYMASVEELNQLVEDIKNREEQK